ncbi:hypothetical protein CO115_03700 [Candidatus Falkowbacteria bacterium CG_4_9_14_3_um_filter_36_9]|uniref:Uncharacterized protein n=2 Tax=Patescibacteria group TaxID=1783273 RepID=A0A2M7DQM7_9BACT|nr:MAG: hypothetical protein COS18_00515 [Candidatus Falkowbacteria bacterium CG02_land_8_20_14_3_00_36_14]PIX11163.1 MAG: hypothetical protein COZ73_03360 [Candidatus Falkowbacteria bacterium CG_4_8_14_3_um_filter_36_11]PIX67815.1 MAG: hypothetical protein COZ41_02970 [Candidatus Shapirobacteria bacterium CG_4_10_14_3_um_filter_35_13]PJA10257.1 MAG: hypothetical protein COX67_05035 [Candidatus Falkowbacteria bacterium CG_4_10_14_0_2_um_filter_36_22]PJB18829.1 MAG: hypothetical protein CO115_03
MLKESFYNPKKSREIEYRKRGVLPPDFLEELAGVINKVDSNRRKTKALCDKIHKEYDRSKKKK